MKNIDSKSHVRGESIYLDDIPLVQGTLFACVFDSPVAHGKLKSIDTTDGGKCEGVVRVITAKDLVGENQIGGIVPDEPLLADGEVHFQGMPIAIVVARVGRACTQGREEDHGRDRTARARHRSAGRGGERRSDRSAEEVYTGRHGHGVRRLRTRFRRPHRA